MWKLWIETLFCGTKVKMLLSYIRLKNNFHSLRDIFLYMHRDTFLKCEITTVTVWNFETVLYIYIYRCFHKRTWILRLGLDMLVSVVQQVKGEVFKFLYIHIWNQKASRNKVLNHTQLKKMLQVWLKLLLLYNEILLKTEYFRNKKNPLLFFLTTKQIWFIHHSNMWK